MRSFGNFEIVDVEKQKTKRRKKLKKRRKTKKKRKKMKNIFFDLFWKTFFVYVIYNIFIFFEENVIYIIIDFVFLVKLKKKMVKMNLNSFLLRFLFEGRLVGLRKLYKKRVDVVFIPFE